MTDLLDAVRKMGPAEYDAFIEKVLAARPRQPTNTLSAQETKLIERINRALQTELSKRYARLMSRRSKWA